MEDFAQENGKMTKKKAKEKFHQGGNFYKGEWKNGKKVGKGKYRIN